MSKRDSALQQTTPHRAASSILLPDNIWQDRKREKQRERTSEGTDYFDILSNDVSKIAVNRKRKKVGSPTKTI